MQTVKPAETDRYLITVSKGKQWRVFVKDAQTGSQRTTKPGTGYSHL